MARAAEAERCPACGASWLRPALSGPDRFYGIEGEFIVAVCGECGTGTTLPPADPEELAAYYPGEYVAFGAVDGGGLASLASAAVRRWQSWLAFRTRPLSIFRRATRGRVLDVGCGRGDLGAAFIEQGWRVTGVEPSPAACAEARKRGLDARCGTMGTVELESNAYDAAVFRQSLEHVPEPLDDLTRVWNALRPGGLVVVSVPDFGSWYCRAFGTRWFHLELPRHRVHFTRSGLEQVLRRAGFEPMQVSTSTSTIGLPASLQYAVFGRCVFPRGLRFRIATAACLAVFPVAWLLDRVLRDGDGLNVIARRV